MKIRLGYVSNSSSSSFCLFGYAIAEDAVDEEIYEGIAGRCTRQSGLNYAYGIDQYNGSTCVGLGPESIRDEETGLEFKERIFAAIKATFPELNISKNNLDWLTDGGYDG